MSYIHVLPSAPVEGAYTYKGDAAPGQVVRVSFGRQKIPGLVVGQGGKPDMPDSKIKAADIIDYLPRLPDDMRDFMARMADWTMIPHGQVLRLSIPNDALLAQPTRKTRASIPPAQYDQLHYVKTVLNDEQRSCADAVNEAQGYQTFLLDGVTGSGKTEVFFDAVAHVIAQGKQALIMMPEIGLSNMFVKRFEDRFGTTPGLWHSGVTPARRRAVWQGVLRGDTKIVLGARSALFLPFQNLGLIVVDEEHDASYKQEEGAIYNARDMAVLRAYTADIPIVLSSATPSMETMHNAQTGRYKHLMLSNRYGVAEMPTVSLIDLRHDAPEPGQFLSRPLLDAVADTVAKGHQAMLFLNRRGYAPLTLCRSCGHRLECPQCTAWLVEHKQSGRTFCHHCGFGGRSPKACPSCAAEGSLTPIGPGVERVAEEIANAFPDARTTILSSDMGEGEDLQDILQTIREERVDIIIGTQMIAKGHHFPNLAYVAVVDGDLGMDGGDFRAGERTWQLLHQVAGRAGRESVRGHVSIQTYQADSRFMTTLAAQDRDCFLDQELSQRQMAMMPPFAKLAGIILSDIQEKRVEQAARHLAQSIPHLTDVQILGPATPPMAMLRGRHRRRFLLSADKGTSVQTVIREWLARVTIPASTKVQIDIDPQSFF